MNQLEESEKCINFLENNGWKFSYNDNKENEDANCAHYDKDNYLSVSIDFNEKSITFFDGSGDIHTCNINIYTLIGFLFHLSQISFNYYKEFHVSKQTIDRINRRLPENERV